MKWGTLKQHWDKALGMRMYTLDYSEIAYGVFFQHGDVYNLIY